MSGSICVENQYFTFVCLSEEQQPRTVRLLTHFETRNHEIFIKIPCAAFKNYHQNLISFFVKLENVFFQGSKFSHFYYYCFQSARWKQNIFAMVLLGNFTFGSENKKYSRWKWMENVPLFVPISISALRS